MKKISKLIFKLKKKCSIFPQRSLSITVLQLALLFSMIFLDLIHPRVVCRATMLCFSYFYQLSYHMVFESTLTFYFPSGLGSLNSISLYTPKMIEKCQPFTKNTAHIKWCLLHSASPRVAPLSLPPSVTASGAPQWRPTFGSSAWSSASFLSLILELQRKFHRCGAYCSHVYAEETTLAH